jgi:hypothetical protein
MNANQRPGTARRGEGDAQAFEEGRAAGQYSQPTSASAEGITITTGNSPWLGMRCLTCNQTFRRGDRVRVSHEHGTQHLDLDLHCARDVPHAGPEAPEGAGAAAPAVTAVAEDRRGFAAGLLHEWPPLNDAMVVTLVESNWQVTKPNSGPASPVCPGCGHTFRAGDAVIICPCAETPADVDYRICQLAVHRDPAAGLACWDDWCPSGRLKRCPRTHEKLPE